MFLAFINNSKDSGNTLPKCNLNPLHNPKTPFERIISLAEYQLDVGLGISAFFNPSLRFLLFSRTTVAPVDILLACSSKNSSCLWILTNSN